MENQPGWVPPSGAFAPSPGCLATACPTAPSHPPRSRDTRPTGCRWGRVSGVPGNHHSGESTAGGARTAGAARAAPGCGGAVRAAPWGQRVPRPSPTRSTGGRCPERASGPPGQGCSGRRAPRLGSLTGGWARVRGRARRAAPVLEVRGSEVDSVSPLGPRAGQTVGARAGTRSPGRPARGGQESRGESRAAGAAARRAPRPAPEAAPPPGTETRIPPQPGGKRGRPGREGRRRGRPYLSSPPALDSPGSARPAAPGAPRGPPARVASRRAPHSVGTQRPPCAGLGGAGRGGAGRTGLAWGRGRAHRAGAEAARCASHRDFWLAGAEAGAGARGGRAAGGGPGRRGGRRAWPRRNPPEERRPAGLGAADSGCPRSPVPRRGREEPSRASPADAPAVSLIQPSSSHFCAEVAISPSFSLQVAEQTCTNSRQTG